jgi:hypothetical protein
MPIKLLFYSFLLLADMMDIPRNLDLLNRLWESWCPEWEDSTRLSRAADVKSLLCS